MSDSYQAIYDAVRSRITNGDIGHVIERVAREAFDISFVVPSIANDFASAIAEHRRPSVLYRPELTLDGNMYCALYGSNLMDGCAGFGETAELAMRDFDRNWEQMKAPTPLRALTPGVG